MSENAGIRTVLWMNQKTGESEHFEGFPPEDRILEFLPQIPEAKDLYDACREAGMSLEDSVVLILKVSGSVRNQMLQQNQSFGKSYFRMAFFICGVMGQSSCRKHLLSHGSSQQLLLVIRILSLIYRFRLWFCRRFPCEQIRLLIRQQNYPLFLLYT